MKRNFSIQIALFCITVLAACTKHAGDMEETIPAATITFAAPTEGAIYKTGDSVRIQGVAVSSAVMHGCQIAIRNAADTSVVYYAEHVHDHNNTITINHAWKNTLTMATNLQVEVILALDHDGHTGTKTVAIKTVAN
jgi:hypothetical protein